MNRRDSEQAAHNLVSRLPDDGDAVLRVRAETIRVTFEQIELAGVEAANLNQNGVPTNLNNNNTYSRLMGLTGVGANAASNLNSTINSGTQAMANNLTGNAQAVGSDITGVGNAQAAGTVGQANAYGGALQGAGNAIGGAMSLSSLLGAQNASNSGGTSGAFNVGNPYAGAGGNTGFIGAQNTYDPYSNQLQAPS